MRKTIEPCFLTNSQLRHLVADAVDRHDVPRLARVGFDLLAQIIDVAIEGALEDFAVIAQLVEQMGAAEHLAGILGGSVRMRNSVAVKFADLPPTVTSWKL